MSPGQLESLGRSVRAELDGNLLPFWSSRVVDTSHGGFIGWMSKEGLVNTEAPKGLILNARLLWTFSAVYRFDHDVRRRDLAQRAADYLAQFFWDGTHGGVFWQVDAQGRCLDDKKKIYGQAFYLYALAEYFQAVGDEATLERAKELFELIEAHSHDAVNGGYIEVCNRDWSEAQDLRLSDKDMDEKESMNNHLHLLEAYTNLYRIWPEANLRVRLVGLLDIFAARIADPATGHLNHFFDESWQPKSDDYTFGHDIEASWLLCEAAEVLDDPALMSRVQEQALRLAHIVLTEGVDHDGGLCYRGQHGHVVDPNREWWPQVESVVGFLNAFQLSGEQRFFEAARHAWQYLEKRFVDAEHGEWFWRVDPLGRPDPTEPKVSEWKGPYHGVRGCLEILKRLRQIAASNPKL
ncbi:MAG: AGE family epimerase/isomerase [Sedimentisphaerales bacterium]|nr:AGE family epimerase/isomerase [Sedimentisphaerales bacterium]